MLVSRPGLQKQQHPPLSRRHSSVRRLRGGQRRALRPLHSLRVEERRRLDTLDDDDPYKVLGVSYDTNHLELKSRFIELSRALHPDKDLGDPNASKRYHRVFEAYQRLRIDNEEHVSLRNGGHEDSMLRGGGLGLSRKRMTMSDLEAILAMDHFKPLIGDSPVGAFMVIFFPESIGEEVE
eukprot:jgi/Bigna1/138850/aug1.47_g13558